MNKPTITRWMLFKHLFNRHSMYLEIQESGGLAYFKGMSYCAICGHREHVFKGWRQ